MIGLEIVDGFVLYLILIIGGLMIVKGKLLDIVCFVGILGKIVVVFFRGIMILFVMFLNLCCWIWSVVIN